MAYSFPNLEPVCCSTFDSNCCFLTYIQVSQEEGEVVWYSHLIKNFPQFVVIHTVKGFSVVNETEVDVFLEFSSFFCDPEDIGNLISGSSAFSKSSLYIWKFSVHIPLKSSLKDFEHYLAAKSCQSCPTLCDPIDVSPPGSPIPGILQARTLEWVAISFSSA